MKICNSRVEKCILKFLAPQLPSEFTFLANISRSVICESKKNKELSHRLGCCYFIRHFPSACFAAFYSVLIRTRNFSRSAVPHHAFCCVKLSSYNVSLCCDVSRRGLFSSASSSPNSYLPIASVVVACLSEQEISSERFGNC